MSRGHFQFVGGMRRVVVLLGMVQTHGAYALSVLVCQIIGKCSIDCPPRDSGILHTGAQSLDPITCSFHQRRNNSNGSNCQIDCSLPAGYL